MSRSFQIHNGSRLELEVRVEPWGESHQVGAGGRMEVLVEGGEGDPCFELGDGWVAFYGWTGAILEKVVVHAKR